MYEDGRDDRVDDRTARQVLTHAVHARRRPAAWAAFFAAQLVPVGLAAGLLLMVVFALDWLVVFVTTTFAVLVGAVAAKDSLLRPSDTARRSHGGYQHQQDPLDYGRGGDDQ